MSSLNWHDVGIYERKVVRETATAVMNPAKLRYSESASPLESLVRPEWQMHAACRGVGPNKSHPAPVGGGRGSSRAGVAATTFIHEYCDHCSVVAECLAYALAHETVPIGVWGGMTATARARLQRGQTIGRRRHSGMECGTAAGYQRHRRAGEVACSDCVEAHTRSTRDYKDAARLRALAERRAVEGRR